MEISIIPRFIIKIFTTNFYRQNDINILISNVFIIVFFIIFKNSIIEIMNSVPHFCLFDKLTGIKCPVCGMTRAFCAIFQGNFILAFKLNHISFCVLLIFILQIPFRLISLLKENLQNNINIVSKKSSILILIIILGDWFINLIIAH